MAVDKPRWDGGFAAARRIASDILSDFITPEEEAKSSEPVLVERIAEALVEAFDDGVLAEHNAREEPETKRVILTKLLREHGIGIATLEEVRARTTAIARGELKPDQAEPKLWFSSIEYLVKFLKNSVEEKSENMTKENCQ